MLQTPVNIKRGVAIITVLCATLTAYADHKLARYWMVPEDASAIWVDISRANDLAESSIRDSDAIRVTANSRDELGPVLRGCVNAKVKALSIIGRFDDFSPKDVFPLFEQISPLKRLGLMRLSSAGGFECLPVQNVPQLEIVDFSDSDVNDAAAEWLGRLPNLRVLDLSRTLITDEALSALRKSKSLKRLSLGGVRVSGEGFKTWKPNSDLEYLDLSYTSLSSLGAINLARFTRLKVLNLDGTDVVKDIPDLLRELPQLRALSIGGDVVRDRRGPYVDDVLLSHVANMPHLEYLDVSMTRVTTKGVSFLATAKGLQALDVSGTRIDVNAFPIIGKIKNITWLNVGGITVDDDAMREIDKLSNLTSLELSFCEITDERIRQLMGLKKLKVLKLNYTGITTDAAPMLKGLPSLTELEIEGTVFAKNSDARRSLKKALPICTIIPNEK